MDVTVLDIHPFNCAKRIKGTILGMPRSCPVHITERITDHATFTSSTGMSTITCTQLEI